ncbi:MAG: redoxin domain-containing protein [Acidobacteriota bacterium]
MKERTLAVSVFLIVLFASSLTTLAQNKPQTGPKDGTELAPADLNRIKVGMTAPDFQLEDQDGNLVSLSSFRGKQTVVLVFYRGYW